MLFHKASLLPKERGFLFSHYEWLRSFLSRLTSLISSLISSRVISGNSPLSAIAQISANTSFALAVTSSSSSWAFCRLSFRMVSDYFTRITHGIPRIRPIRSWAETTSYRIPQIPQISTVFSTYSVLR